MTTEIIRITDVFLAQDDDADMIHFQVMTPDGPKELRVDYESYNKLSYFLDTNPGNYMYEEYEN